jgi:hypothetical protein
MAPPDSGSGIDRMLGTTRTYDAVFTDKKNNDSIKASDFLSLMVAQMKNQDFLNPMDDTQFVTQMAQFSTMQQMMELAEWSKSNYAMSLVGKNVTASRFNVSGGLDTTEGMVDRISFVDNEYILYIGEKRYTLNQIMEVHASAAKSAADTDADSETKALDATKLSVKAAEPTANALVVYWESPVSDSAKSALLRYTVYISTEGPFDTLEAVKKGTPVLPLNRSDKVATIPDLEPETEYYVNIVVNDAKGAESLYQPVKISTKALADAALPVVPPPVEPPPVEPPPEEVEGEGEDIDIDEPTDPEGPSEPGEGAGPDTPAGADGPDGPGGTDGQPDPEAPGMPDGAAGSEDAQEG